MYSCRPAILEDMSQVDSHIAALKKLNLVGFAGGQSTTIFEAHYEPGANVSIGNLAREAGNRLVEKGVTLTNIISATE